MPAPVRERPIVFAAESVRAVLEGRKTQTRRINSLDRFNVEPSEWVYLGTLIASANGPDRNHVMRHANGGLINFPCPCGKPGDRLWVQEGWRWFGRSRAGVEGGFQYRESLMQRKFQDFTDARARWHDVLAAWDSGKVNKWRSPIHMRRWASRITLEITRVRVERLQEISEADARAEGIQVDDCGHAIRPDDDINWGSAVGAYAELWNSINKKAPWASNPWVWVLEFKKVA